MKEPSTAEIARLLFELIGPELPIERSAPMNHDEERKIQLRGRVIANGEPTMREVQTLIDDRRPFVFVPCPSCAESFFMTFALFGAGGQLWFLPNLISEALAQHHTEEHPTA